MASNVSEQGMISPYKIVIAPDPVLKQVAQNVPRFDDRIKKLKTDMLTTMYSAAGVGLAAPQIGISERILVTDIVRDENEKPQPRIFVNPVILKSSGYNSAYEEGCLSLPDFHVEIERPEWVQIQYLDEDNQLKEMRADGFLATVLQHEIDHLDGILLIDYVSPLKRNMVLRRLTKAKKAGDL